ncbi:RagB/SusD family nutrient uptake outer membrane protein [Sphingobacterium siyangense]|uniref:RagB/SusD family nutrient uptake outer membrane protein n=1 Tax=Sphingobacterium siyangense TaxID=459529 RepID=UPI0020101F85|nr:RagB/SusD family nutrient uptake outer membrane protein [Sphingobacterium siyangense]UQA76726.1 RagB/SusD family nutrient uptake outer membrane protein [Sphingobacterium siyangense]
MKTIIISITLGFATLIFGACDKYLDVQSNNKLVVPKELDDLQKLLDNVRVMNNNFCSRGEKACDDYFIPESNYKALNDVEKLDYIWEDSQYNFSNDWSSMYNVVYIANLVLERLDKIDRNEQNAAKWDGIKGAALFFRANSYLSLLWTYAKAYEQNTAETDLGIVLRETSDFNVKSVRASVDDSYRKVITDLEASISLLPLESDHVVQPSKPAVYGVLARAYLSMRQYDLALKYVELYLQGRNELLDYNNSNEVKLTASFPFSLFNKETTFYMELKATILSNAYSNIDSALYRSYDSNDLRKQAYFKVLNNVINFKGQYSGSALLFGGVATDEIYLIRAECLARAGKLVEAQADLNKLLATRYKAETYKPYLLTEAREVLKVILSERRKELVYRGLRWIDIKRLNLEGQEIVLKRVVDGKEYRLVPNENRYALPLPADIVRIAGIPQNPR